MNKQEPLVVFKLDEQRFALYLPVVNRVVRAVEITALPKAPEIAVGIINMQGIVLPVLNTRKRFNLPERRIHLSDQLIIARTSRRPVALLVDSVAGVLEEPQEKTISKDEILPAMEYVEGVVKLEDGLLLIHDLDTFLSLDEERVLDDAVGAYQADADDNVRTEEQSEEDRG